MSIIAMLLAITIISIVIVVVSVVQYKRLYFTSTYVSDDPIIEIRTEDNVECENSIICDITPEIDVIVKKKIKFNSCTKNKALK